MTLHTNEENKTAEHIPHDDIELSYSQEPHLQVSGLKKHFDLSGGFFDRTSEYVRAVDGISFEIPKGSTFGLVGESGSGKTTAAKTILRLHEPTEGTVELGDVTITDLSSKELKAQRRQMQIVFQDPTSSLNPRRRVRDIIREPLEIHDVGTKANRNDRVEELLEKVNLPQEYLYKHPTALSGGQKQRVGIARTIALNPEFIVLDEPTSALDVSVQASIVSLLNQIQDEYNLTYLFISHDLSLVKNVSDWIGVMYLGQLVELGRTEYIYRNPQHPYTRALLSAIHVVDDEDEDLKPQETNIEGEIPDPREKPSGCAFRTRCPHAFDACANIEPGMYRVQKNHYARCLLHEEQYEDPDWIA